MSKKKKRTKRKKRKKKEKVMGSYLGSGSLWETCKRSGPLWSAASCTFSCSGSLWVSWLSHTLSLDCLLLHSFSFPFSLSLSLYLLPQSCLHLWGAICHSHTASSPPARTVQPLRGKSNIHSYGCTPRSSYYTTRAVLFSSHVFFPSFLQSTCVC